MSPHHFSLRFKSSVGVAPHQWVTRARVREAGRLLRARQMSVAEVAFSLGFASQSHFTDVFRRLTGTTPKRYQQQRDSSLLRIVGRI
jgi:AraC family transcriptional regulator